MLSWIETHGGSFDVKVDESREGEIHESIHYVHTYYIHTYIHMHIGWSLSSKRDVMKGEELIRIPKSLCFYAEPDRMEVCMHVLYICR